MKSYGSQEMVAPLRRVILKCPQEAFISDQNIERQWKELNYLSRPDLQTAIREHEKDPYRFTAGVEVLFFQKMTHRWIPFIHTIHVSLLIRAVRSYFKRAKSRAEAKCAMEDAFHQWNIPVLGRVDGDATAEGGDLVWLNQRILLAGRGFRTNAAGIEALRKMLEPLDVQVYDFDLPYWNGPGDVLHLMSFISMLDSDLAIVYRRLMPAPLFQFLETRKVQMIDVPDSEYDSLGCNILTIAPRKVFVIRGNPITWRSLKGDRMRSD